MKQIILTFLLFALPFILFSQLPARVSVSISGTVRTSEKAPLPYANVKFTSNANESHVFGTTTDNEGRFSVKVPQGIYSMEVSFVGYAKFTSSVEASKDVRLPDDILLSPASNLIDEVVVRAKTVTYKPNGYVVGISNNPFYREQELDNILKLTPGTNIHPLLGVTVYGQRISKLYVNNREIRLTNDDLQQYLKSFKGSHIKQIEVISSSGVEENAASSGLSVVKITTDKIDDGGRLTVGSGYTLGFASTYLTPNVNVQWRTGSWSTYLMAGFVSGNRFSSGVSETDFYDSGMKINSENKLWSRVNHNYRATWGIGYDIDEKNLISAEVFLRSSSFFNEKDMINQQKLSGSADFIRTATVNSEETRSFDNLNLSFNYTHLFSKKEQLVFKLDRLQAENDNSQNDLFLYVNDGNIRYEDLNHANNVVYTTSVDYEKSLNKLNGKLSAGLRYSGILNRNEADYNQYKDEVQDEAASYEDAYDYDESVYAVYGKYAFSIRQITASLGLRLEHSVIFPQSVANPDQSLKTDYTDLFPEAGIQWNYNAAKGHNLALNYNRRINRPRMANLNPLIIRENDYFYTQGNPFLKADYADSFTLRSVFFNKYLMNVTYSASNDGVFTEGKVDAGSDVLFQTPENGMKSRYMSIYAEYPVILNQWGNIKLSGSYSFQHSAYLENRSDVWSWNAGMSGFFRLPHGFNLMANCLYFPGNIALFSRSYEEIHSSLQISKSFLKRQLTTNLSFNDLFNVNGSQRRDQFSGVYYQSLKNNFSGYSIMLNVNYTFHWGNKTAKINRANSGNGTERGRLSNN